MKQLVFFVLIVLCAASCGRRNPAPAAVSEPAVFLPVLPPTTLQGDELTDYMSAHYWDRFDFTDTLFLQRVDTLQMLDAYAAYVSMYVPKDDPSPITELMRRASSSRAMLTYFYMLAGRVSHDPNSPLRSDEHYIPVLEAVCRSPLLPSWEQDAARRDLQLAMQNLPGELANDFRYTLASGSGGTLYGIDADFTLLFISNPGCPMCRQLRREITASPLLGELIERGELKVLMLYPDEDLAEWRQAEVPPAWINAYDKGCMLRTVGLYDTRAIPALYLLDRAKRVLVKDSVSVPEIEEAVAGAV